MNDTVAQYQLMVKQLDSLLQGESNYITNLSQFSALVFNSLKDINWAGFYLLIESEQPSYLQLGPFQGQVACTKIPIGKGVCGTAAELKKPIIVEDVDAFDGHIACDSRSRSEIVYPILCGNELIGVLDVDSPLTKRFSEDDKEGLQKLIDILTKHTVWP